MQAATIGKMDALRKDMSTHINMWYKAMHQYFSELLRKKPKQTKANQQIKTKQTKSNQNNQPNKHNSHLPESVNKEKDPKTWN